MKRLIINADDYGVSPEVNRAIESLINKGRLKNLSVLTNTSFYEETINFLRQNIFCSIGIHLNVVEGTPISRNEKIGILLNNHSQFISLRQLLIRWLHSPLSVSQAVETEWRSQIEKILNDNLVITHADSHQHIHAFPPFWGILVKLCREYQIPCLRSPIERNKIKKRRLSAFALEQSNRVSHFLTPTGELFSNDNFLGFKRAGDYGETEIIFDLENLNQGVTELIIHPSFKDHFPYPDYKGAQEYQALVGSKVWEKIDELGIEIISWTELID